MADANLQPRDRALLANAPYAHVTLPVAYQRTVVEFHRKEAAGSIVIDTDARYLYYVLADNKAIRYGVAVGEQALSWYGVAKIGRKAEWPSWTPTEEIRRRRGNIPDFVEGGPHNPMGARALYLYQGDSQQRPSSLIQVVLLFRRLSGSASPHQQIISPYHHPPSVPFMPVCCALSSEGSFVMVGCMQFKRRLEPTSTNLNQHTPDQH